VPHERIDLCGLWRFQPDPSGEGEKAAYFHPEYDPGRWREVLLPGDFDTSSPNLDTYEGEGWFRRTLTVPAGWRGKRIVLRFEGINYHAKVWVNGQEVGEHHDGFLPFEFPIQDFIHLGSENLIAVRADNFRREGEVPGLQRGWRTFGGILREMELVATDLLYLDHIAISAEPPRTRGEGGRLAIRARARNERAHTVNADLLVQVMDSEGRTFASFASQPVTVETNAEAVFSTDGQVEGVKLWSPAEPNLYTAKVELRLSGLPVDEREIRFGFRKIQARKGELLLNGEPIYLTGFNRHEDSPRRNMSPDPETVRRDLIDMKEAGANFVRLCHYPHHPGEIDLCNELGMLVMGEIPLYWWDGCQEGEANCIKKLEAAKRQLKAMIQRDINHPSVIFWSVSNETHEERPEVADGNRQLIRLAKELDATRLAVHVSDHWKQNPQFNEDDVICVNDYPSLNRRGYRGQHDYDLSESTRYWRENLRTLHEQYPHKPILISEFGYASFEGLYDNGFSEDLQAQAIEMEFAGMDAPYVCGATVWCWADHPWPQATFAFCRHVGLSPYGVVTRERRKLKAYWTVRKLFREKQGLQEQPRAAASPGTGVFMIRPDLLNIPQVSFPEGFSIRPMRLDEVGLWTDIQRDAEEYFKITDETFYHEFGSDLQAIQWRSFIITNEKGVGVGTISAWYSRDFKGEDYGRIHWLAVRPAYQRRGIGKAALSYVLNKLAQWHSRCFLDTSIERLPAIKLYLDFGFMPDLYDQYEIEKWREVKDKLKHPSLEKVLTHC
jgi:GNAT superfamily N-acetyltransferase